MSKLNTRVPLVRVILYSVLFSLLILVLEMVIGPKLWDNMGNPAAAEQAGK